MDFAKAVNKVLHKLLTLKLYHYGIRGHTLQWIKSFPSGTTQQVLVEGKQSGSAPVTSGVPKGTVLGPILFLTFTNNLPQWAQHSKIRLFADDCIIQKEIRSNQDCHQQDINSIAKWEREWLMEFNPSKCQTLTIPASPACILHDYHLHSTLLERPEEASTKYLSVILQADLKWNQNIQQMIAKASSTLGLLRRNVRVWETAPCEPAYKALVCPQVEFAAPAWLATGPHSSQEPCLGGTDWAPVLSRQRLLTSSNLNWPKRMFSNPAPPLLSFLLYYPFNLFLFSLPLSMPYNGCWQWPAHHIPHSTLLQTLWHHIDFGRPGKIPGGYAIPWPHLEPSHWGGRHQSQPETWFHQEKSQKQSREAEETSLHHPGQIRSGVCIGHLGPSSSQGQRPTGKMPTSRCVLD